MITRVLGNGLKTTKKKVPSNFLLSFSVHPLPVAGETCIGICESASTASTKAPSLGSRDSTYPPTPPPPFPLYFFFAIQKAYLRALGVPIPGNRSVEIINELPHPDLWRFRTNVCSASLSFLLLEQRALQLKNPVIKTQFVKGHSYTDSFGPFCFSCWSGHRDTPVDDASDKHIFHFIQVW